MSISPTLGRKELLLNMSLTPFIYLCVLSNCLLRPMDCISPPLCKSRSTHTSAMHHRNRIISFRAPCSLKRLPPSFVSYYPPQPPAHNSAAPDSKPLLPSAHPVSAPPAAAPVLSTEAEAEPPATSSPAQSHSHDSDSDTAGAAARGPHCQYSCYHSHNST